jgi:dihydrofolate synthase / folylpolyglutamate synthase
MNYQQTVNWIFEKLPMFHRIGAAAYKADLNNTLKLLEIAGNPHENLICVHVAGTNGKGSVSHMLASILQESGAKTGLYTSPHLFDYRERMKIDGKKIPENFVTSFISKYKAHIEEIQPSFFEISVVLCFSWFVSEKIDVAVIETGMGGRLDSTNVVNPMLSVITNIGLDHTMFLGDTLQKIAAEKAGIIKKNTPVVIGEYQQLTYPIFKNIAKLKNSEITCAEQSFCFFTNHAVTKKLCGNILYKGNPYINNLCSPLSGKYQKKNIITTIAAIKILKKNGLKISKNHILKGIKHVIKNTSIQGRWQLLCNKPRVYCDVAHNNEGLTLVFEQLQLMKYDKLHIVFGVNNDKNLEQLFKILPVQAHYYFCSAEVPRSMDENRLALEAQKRNLLFSAHKTVAHAFEQALMNANLQNDIVFVGGSTFVVAELPIELFNKRK